MKQKNRFKTVIIAIFALFLILAIYYYSYTTLKEKKGQENILTYNGYNFYVTQIGEVPFYTLSFGVGTEPNPKNPKPYLYNFRYFPMDLEYIPVESRIVEGTLYSSPGRYKEEMYISVSPEFTDQEALAAFGLFQILSSTEQGVFKIPTQMAFFAPYPEETGIPIKSCEDATNQVGVILLKKADNEKIYKDEGCIILQGKDLEGLRKVSEKLTYMLLKVMKE